jgi:hypothetical protein
VYHRLHALRPFAALIAVAAVASAVVISRRPDAFTYPQFYAEDGICWFADAYVKGAWQALFISYQGHFLLQTRLVALIAAPLGVLNAPLVYNLCGLAIQIAPVVFFMSNRFSKVVPSVWFRAALCAVYLLIPSGELQVSNNDAQFHLVVLAALVLIAPPPSRWWWRAFDVATVALCALTGGFVYVLVVAAVIWWWVRRQRWTAVLTGVLFVGLAAQLYSLTLAARLPATLGSGPLDMAKDLLFIGSDRVILAGLFAEEAHTHVFVNGLPHGAVLAAGICLVGLAVVAFAAIRAPWELRIFALVGFGIAAAGLAAPLVAPGTNAWDILAVGGDDRYFFMAEAAWVVIVLWALWQLPRGWLRAGGWSLTAAAFVSGLVVAWQYPAFVNYHWPQEAAEITAAGPAAHLSLPINPPSWDLALPPDC